MTIFFDEKLKVTIRATTKDAAIKLKEDFPEIKRLCIITGRNISVLAHAHLVELAYPNLTTQEYRKLVKTNSSEKDEESYYTHIRKGGKYKLEKNFPPFKIQVHDIWEDALMYSNEDGDLFARTKNDFNDSFVLV